MRATGKRAGEEQPPNPDQSDWSKGACVADSRYRAPALSPPSYEDIRTLADEIEAAVPEKARVAFEIEVLR
jgi:hypothetical protein